MVVKKKCLAASRCQKTTDNNGVSLRDPIVSGVASIPGYYPRKMVNEKFYTYKYGPRQKTKIRKQHKNQAVNM